MVVSAIYRYLRVYITKYGTTKKTGETSGTPGTRGGRFRGTYYTEFESDGKTAEINNERCSKGRGTRFVNT